MRDFEPLKPGCMKCEQVTGNVTCFPGPCVFYNERNLEGSKANQIAMLDRIRRGVRDPVRASAMETRSAETAGFGPQDDSAVAESQTP